MDMISNPPRFLIPNSLGNFNLAFHQVDIKLKVKKWGAIAWEWDGIEVIWVYFDNFEETKKRPTWLKRQMGSKGVTNMQAKKG